MNGRPTNFKVCRLRAVHGNYSDLPEALAEFELQHVDGILLDVGLSSDQLADNERGFSFQSDGPLDLRFDTTRGTPAARLIERLSAEHLADLIYQFGEERYSRRIARKIVEARRTRPIETAAELAYVVRGAVPRSRDDRIDPATRTFQALRIAVNEELKWLEVALRRLPECLVPGGRMAVISFHSLEDRLVKQSFIGERLIVNTRRPVRRASKKFPQTRARGVPSFELPSEERLRVSRLRLLASRRRRDDGRRTKPGCHRSRIWFNDPYLFAGRNRLCRAVQARQLDRVGTRSAPRTNRSTRGTCHTAGRRSAEGA